MDQVSVGLTSNTGPKFPVMYPARFVLYMNTVFFFVVYQHYILGIDQNFQLKGPWTFLRISTYFHTENNAVYTNDSWNSLMPEKIASTSTVCCSITGNMNMLHNKPRHRVSQNSSRASASWVVKFLVHPFCVFSQDIDERNGYCGALSSFQKNIISQKSSQSLPLLRFKAVLVSLFFSQEIICSINLSTS